MEEEVVSREMNIVELFLFLAWFSCGFVPGYFVGSSTGLLGGLAAGFAVWLLVYFAVNRWRLRQIMKHSKRER